MKCIATEKAVGHVLCHDITQIIPGVFKGPRFRKGHIVQPEDVPVLLSMGKERLYIWELEPGFLHEDVGAARLLALCGSAHMYATQVKEGKIELLAECDGLFQVDAVRLLAINMCEELVIATRKGGTAVKKGDKLAGMRVIPLVIREERLRAAEQAAGEAPLLQLLPWRRKTAALIVTGSEVYKGRIQDSFGPAVAQKLACFGVQVLDKQLCPDDKGAIRAAIARARGLGAEIILCTGGMSVDPDDQTPAAIRDSGAHIVSYGAPVLPGAMLLLGYYPDGTPVLGLPAWLCDVCGGYGI